MNEDRLKLLVHYLDVLSRLEGKYHTEVKVAIAMIEQEFGITREIKEKIK